MTASQPDPRRTLDRPLPPGGTLSLVRGGEGVLLERQGGQCRVVHVREGEPAEELLLGLDGRAVLRLQVLLPERPLVLELEPVVALAPGGWLKGYLLLPVVWELWVGPPGGPARFLASLPPEGLRLAFLGTPGREYVHPFPARLRPRRPFLKEGAAGAVLPLHLVNRRPRWEELRRIFLPLEGVGLRRLGRAFVADPVRVTLAPEGARLEVKGQGPAGAAAREAAS